MFNACFQQATYDFSEVIKYESLDLTLNDVIQRKQLSLEDILRSSIKSKQFTVS